jgi:hypothetical protein
MLRADSPKEWLRVAKERLRDAEAMLPARSRSNGPIYMAG